MRSALPIEWCPLVCAAAAIAACGDGARSDGPVSAGAWFEESARERGLVFEHASGAEGEYFMPEIMGGGAALFDMDGDGDLDAYLVQSGSVAPGAEQQPSNRLFENDGSGSFRDVTRGSGSEDPRYGMGAACGDVDGDGDTDLYVTNVGRNTLLVNDGGGRFHDGTEAAGVGHEGWGASAAFFDADADGRLDLFVTNYVDWSVETELPCRDPLSRLDYCSPKNYETPAADVFYRNLGGGRFEDASVSSGVAAERGNGLGVACADFDGDGRIDVFVANDGMPDALWINAGGGVFENRAAQWGCAVDLNGVHKAGMGVALGDIDADGDVDLMVCNLEGESDSFFLNQGAYFSDGTVRAGLAGISKTFTRFGMGWVDLDNDGLLDLYQANGRVVRPRGDVAADDPYAEVNLVFRGLGGGRFEEVLPRSDSLVATSRAAAFGDVDGDGAVDVLVVNRDAPAHLFMNRAAAASADSHWLSVLVRERSGGVALGATLTIRVGAREIRRDVRAAYSYLASNDPRVHIGLGAASSVDGVRVRWTDGSEEEFGALALDRGHVLTRSSE